jgi:quercetin dioxygenase-like cupin family protein
MSAKVFIKHHKFFIMKHQFLLLLIFAGGLMISCKQKESSEPIGGKTSTASAPMIIPESKDTLLPNGRRNIFLVSRRELPGLFVERAIFPPGYRSNLHTHPGDLNITVISGSLNIIISETADTTAPAKVYGPGSFVVIPANKPHFEWFTERTAADITGIGPLTTVNIPIVHSSNQP